MGYASPMRYFLIDAFAEGPFRGNPAAVCLLDRALPDRLMAALAGEFALSETAFLLPEGKSWRLRWFSPAMEIPLCGHGTLASARALREAGFAMEGETLRFETLAGGLSARLEGELVELDFPVRPADAAPLPAAVAAALRLREEPRWCGVNRGRNWLLDLSSAAAVLALEPDRGDLMALGRELHGVIVTGRGDSRGGGGPGGEAAVSSRFFAPEAGVFEDPVTGSAHCALAPYWAPILGKNEFLAWQASERGGLLRVRLDGERVFLAGRSVVVAEGSIRDAALAD